MNQIALQVISIVVLNTFAPVIIINELIMLAGFSTQRQIEGFRFIEWDVFYGIKKIDPLFGVTQKLVVFFVS